MATGDLRDWDMTWPQKLISERRFLYLGSADLALCVELTPAETGSPARYHDLDDHVRPWSIHATICAAALTTKSCGTSSSRYAPIVT